MICPVCYKGKLLASHTYDGGPGKLAQRRKCSNPECRIVATAVCKVLHIDPARGKGAQMVARQLSITPPEEPGSPRSE